MDNLYYATITEDSSGQETYGTPQFMAHSINADLSIELAEAELHADDAVLYSVKEFQSGTLKLGVADLAPEVISVITGAVIDDNGVLLSTAEDSAGYVALGFRSRKPKGVYHYYWLYKVKFGIPSISLETKGTSINFKTPQLEGTIMCRNKPDDLNHRPWKAEVVEGVAGVAAATLATWFDEVYEPVIT
jgi:phi13 family phage major tail protein